MSTRHNRDNAAGSYPGDPRSNPRGHDNETTRLPYYMAKLREAERAQGRSVTEDLAVMERNLERATNLRDITRIDEHLKACASEVTQPSDAAQPREDGDAGENQGGEMDSTHENTGASSLYEKTATHSLSAPLARDSGNGNGQLNLPQITLEEEELERKALSRKERLFALEDLYGRKYPGDLETKRHLDSFDREMIRLPKKETMPLDKCYTVKQACLFLDIENNDARRAAKRMAMFWEKRFKLYGNDTFLEGQMPRTEEDFRRVYEMALKAPIDPEVDEETKHWARSYANRWNREHLLRLEQELTKIPYHKKAAFVEAQKTIPNVAASDDHKLQFLRSEDYDANRASQRLVKYWDYKVDLFGQEDAFRPITLDDLMRDHHKELFLGWFWYMRGTDAFGRALIYFLPGKAHTSLMPDQGCTEEGLLKVAWYMLHEVVEELSCHGNGIVFLVDARPTILSTFKPSFASKLNLLFHNGTPVNIKAVHLLAPQLPLFFNIFLPFIKWLMGKTSRMRLWVHTGNNQSCLSALRECGISHDMIPATLGGNLDVDQLGKEWIEKRK